MRCHEIRPLSNAWHDSELDARTAFDIQQHLEGCEPCRVYFDGERRVDAQVDLVLRAGGKDGALWERIESQIPDGAASKPAIRRWLRVTVMAAAACMVAGLAIILWPRAPLDLAQAAALDHAKFLAGNMPAQFVDQPSDAELTKAQGRLDRAAFDLLPPAALYQPEGKRLCFLKGVPVAWMLGRTEGKPVSVIALRVGELAQFPGLQQRFAEGHRVACGESGGFQFAAREVGGHVICAVGATSRVQLEALVAAVPASR